MRGPLAIAALLLLGVVTGGCAAIEGLSAYSKGDCSGGDCDTVVDGAVPHADAGHDAGHMSRHDAKADAGPRCDIDGAAYSPGMANPANACQRCEPGTSASAWSSLTDGTDCGMGQICGGGHCAMQCDIGGKVYASSGVNPTNTCETCQPGTSTSSWTDLSDGTTCGTGKVCTAGTCGTGCFIGGMHYATSAANPMNPCELCTPATSTTAWSDVTDGTACGTAKVCHVGMCAGGCEIAGAFYAASAANPNDPCQSCQPSTSTSAWGSVANGTSCGNGQVCASGQCGTQCDIGGTVFATSALNSANACQTCQPGTSTSAWSDLSNGTGCGSGEVCDTGTCGAGCFIGGMVYSSSAPDPANGCQGCVPSTSTSVWSNLRDGTPCGTGGLCYTGACVSGCEIGGVYFMASAANPNNPCQSCQPGANADGWSNIADGTACGNGKICATGTCGAQCEIGGMTYASGAANPMNACQTCQPGTITSAWTSLADGTTCGSGEVCSAVSCLGGCYVSGTYYASSAANPANVCQSCQPATTTSAWNDVAEGTACGTGEVCNGSSCGPGCYIGTTYYAPAAANPADACQSCQPGASTTGWSSADGPSSSCASGDVCSGGSCQAGCFIGGAYAAPGATDPANPCQSCQPGTSTSAWSNVGDGTGCGNGQICSGGQCGTQCDIGGTVYPVGTTNPSNPCQSCQPAMTATGWSNLVDGSGCGAGDVCSSGTCGSGCYIGGTIYSPATANPANDCQSCLPNTSTTTWSNDSDGTGCGAGDVCTQGSCGSGCFIDGTVYTPTEPNPGDPCQTCQPATTTTDWSSLPDWTTCGTGNVCQGGACFPVCTATETSTVNETSPYSVTVPISYSMVGGGGGAGGGPGFWAAGGGGGSSAILSSSSVIDVAAGGNGGVDSGSLGAGTNGTTVANVFPLPANANLTVYVGGGGGGGGWDDGGGGAGGYFGGAGGEYLGPQSAGGAGGSTTGGVGINGGTNGGSLAGGTGGDSGGLGAAGASGGAGGPTWDSGGGGGGFGGGGGACTNDGSDLPSAGGSSGGTAANVTTVQGGLGASTWASAATLPPAAGAGAASEAGQGGNAGLVILQYVSPTGVCSL